MFRPDSVRIFAVLCSLTVLYGCSKGDEPIENLRISMLDEVNKVRQAGCRCGADFMPSVHTLTWNDTLEVAAGRHARDMRDKNYLEHISPDGISPIQRTMEAGYTGNYVGENIGRGYSNINQVMAAWKNSESHCKAMMDSLYYEMGAARADQYWVQEFGRPLKVK